MTILCIINGTAVLPDRLLRDAVVVCRDERISYVGTARSRVPAGAKVIDAKGAYICPGFVDIHIHGGGGADVMDGTVDAVSTVCQSHSRHGTTTLFPTTSTGTDDQIHAMLAACVEVRDGWTVDAGSKIGGVHLYGPYFAKGKVGCHNESVCRTPKAAEFRRYFDTGIVRVATCAAELPGAAAFYRYATKQGCLVTCGHSNSSWSEMDAGFANGMRHVDHFWCAMSNVSSVRNRLGVPMQGSMLEYVLSNPEMSTEVIADGKHLAPELLNFAWRMKGSQRLCLVTDCNRALDMPPGRYRFGPKSDGSWFTSDGEVGWASTGSLASAVMGMDHMVRTMHKIGGVPLHEAVRMATLTPAERTGIDEHVGSLAKGKQADIVLLSKTLKVKQVYINGHRTKKGVRTLFEC
ncbi:N-acetylglucosamine-6-phosphate deacetylase [Rubripirellula lacrimiformis]|uniref:N-acetylglucosamine-6-phosphate deacetylase n=1 Tax=Rubripirellula lacrimiformis TaxID=1930273 RepID=A0A517N9G0_9BACT|nr:N-acetylglucosamine-6-phosphate deacetylase [Rubripirellula lacrimiformis]QDT03776.1 N-acetylglucosamine-6-phosphate deacetylase [Rubripirellula lacrimiformis]